MEGFPIGMGQTSPWSVLALLTSRAPAKAIWTTEAELDAAPDSRMNTRWWTDRVSALQKLILHLERLNVYGS